MEKKDFIKDSEVLKALSHPLRLKILEIIFDHEICVNELSSSLDISQPTSSHHLAILKNSEIVFSRKIGSKVYYSIKDNFARSIISILRSN